MTHRHHRLATLALLAGAAIAVAGCTRADASRLGSAADAAVKVYVPPGSYDEFYAFMSGGFDGQVGVYGLPSGRLLKHVPVFSQNPENGWGYSEQTKAMLTTSYGQVPWDDAHHPQLSQTAGVPDGRWLFINGNNTPRSTGPSSRPTRSSKFRTRRATTRRRSSPRTTSTSWRAPGSACRRRSGTSRSTTTRKPSAAC
jgi:nitrous oxide reductase